MSNLKKIMLVSTATAAVGTALFRYVLYQDLYKTFPNIDRKMLRKAYRRTCVNAVMNKYEANLSTPEIQFLIMDQVVAQK